MTGEIYNFNVSINLTVKDRLSFLQSARHCPSFLQIMIAEAEQMRNEKPSRENAGKRRRGLLTVMSIGDKLRQFLKIWMFLKVWVLYGVT